MAKTGLSRTNWLLDNAVIDYVDTHDGLRFLLNAMAIVGGIGSVVLALSDIRRAEREAG